MSVRVRIENAYEDGHESSREVELEPPEGDIEAWWEDVVFPETGDGHAIGNDMGSFYTATVIAADDPQLVGLVNEWD